MAENGKSYVVFDNIPQERFESYCFPPMPAKDVIVLLAGVSPLDYSPHKLSSAALWEIRRLLVDNMMHPGANRAEVEVFVDERVAEARGILFS
jgi:hypothetical protein